MRTSRAPGYYGFPLNRGIVKIAESRHRHIAYRPEVDDRNRLRDMLRDTFPTLVDAPIVGPPPLRVLRYGRRRLLDRAPPTSPKLVVATGGSGHAFKFAPMLGDIIATIALGEPHPLAHKFRWRTDVAPASMPRAMRLAIVSGAGTRRAAHPSTNARTRG